MDAPHLNSKTELTQFLQRFIGRTMTKEDVVYTNVEEGGQWQATVRLNCKDGEEFAGELCATDKEAQQSAAAQALAAFASEIAALPEKVKKVKAPKAPKPVTAAAVVAPTVKAAQVANGPKVIAAPLKAKGVRVAPPAAGKGAPGAKMTQPPVSEKMVAQGLTANHKQNLSQGLQGVLKKALTKADIVYETVNIGEQQYQSTVTLNCADGQAFVGEVCTTEKLAEHAAAQQAMANASMWGGSTAVATAVVVPARTPPGQGVVVPALKQGTAAAAALGQKRKQLDPTSVNPKSELATFLQRMMKRTLDKTDITYEVAQVATGFQATVTTGCLEGRQFAGEVCEKQKMAEASAAYHAQIALAGEFGQQEAAPKKPRTTAPGAAPGAGKGGGKFTGGAGARTIVEMSTGEVVEWSDNGTFGWIRPDTPVVHPEAERRGGKIYVHKKDVVGGAPVGTGSTVQFKVYTDSKGLGACEVSPL